MKMQESNHGRRQPFDRKPYYIYIYTIFLCTYTYSIFKVRITEQVAQNRAEIIRLMMGKPKEKVTRLSYGGLTVMPKT